jgi:hypothetical protein
MRKNVSVGYPRGCVDGCATGRSAAEDGTKQIARLVNKKHGAAHAR